MSSSFLFSYQASICSRNYNFATEVAEIGEMFMRSPETMGHTISESTRRQIQECFPERGAIEQELNLLKNGSRSALLESISGIFVRYGSRHM